MGNQFKIGATQPYQLYREVEPVPPYPRIDPQRPRDEYPRQQRESRDDNSEHARRRFDAMRKMIDELTTADEVGRVDYLTAVHGLTELGFTILESELLNQLLELNFSADNLGGILEQIAQRGMSSELQPGKLLSPEHNIFPIFIPGLSEYNLILPPLPIPVELFPAPLIEQIETQGYAMTDKNRLHLDFRFAEDGHAHDELVIMISVLVGVSEVDDGGRRVILYRHPDRGYALYADKQIDLSI